MDPQHQKEDTRRLLLAIALSAAVFLVWTLLFPPETPPEQTAEPAPSGQEQTRSAEEGALPGEAPDLDQAPVPQPIPDRPAPSGELVEAAGRREVVVETGVARVVLVNRGAVPVSWRIHGYEGYEDEEDVDLLSRRAFQFDTFPLGMELPEEEAGGQARMAEAFWVVEEEATEEGQRVTFRWADGRGLEAEKVLSFRDGSYLVRAEARVWRDGRLLPVALHWGPGIANHPPEIRKNKYFQQPRIVSQSEEKGFERWTDPEDAPDFRQRRIAWAGVDDQYFAALVLPRAAQAGWAYRTPVKNAAEAGNAEEEDGIPAPVLSIPLGFGREAVDLYVGPKKLEVLEALPGGDLSQVVEMGAYVGFIARWLLKGLVWIHERIVANYGWAIVLMTVLIRLVFFPLTQRSMRSMRDMSTKMKKIKPKQDAIKKKYEGVKDPSKRQKMNEELMALYRQEDVNPAASIGGCLPMLLQMPIFFAFFRMLPAAIELRKEPWLGWIQDLSQPDPFYITPLLMGGAMFFSTRRSMAHSTGQMEGIQKQMFTVMPVMFTVICLWAPSGLVLYWLFSNLIQLGQQELLRRGMPEEEESGKAGPGGSGGSPGGGGLFAGLKKAVAQAGAAEETAAEEPAEEEKPPSGRKRSRKGKGGKRRRKRRR